MTQAVILCGGRGTRLGALTERTPKPLLEIGGGPWLDTPLQHLKRHGVDRVLLLAGFEGERVQEYASKAENRLGLHIDVTVEPTPQGTGGAMLRAHALLDDEFIVYNGDTFFDVDVNDLMACLLSRKRLSAVVAIRSVDDWENLRSGGVYAIRRSFVTRFGAPPCDLEIELRRDWFRVQTILFTSAYFIDIGTPAELERARRELPLIS